MKSTTPESSSVSDPTPVLELWSLCERSVYANLILNGSATDPELCELLDGQGWSDQRIRSSRARLVAIGRVAARSYRKLTPSGRRQSVWYVP